MQPEPTVRAGCAADAECIAALSVQVWLDTYALEGVRLAIAQYVLSVFTPLKFRQRLADPNVEATIAEVNNHLVGFSLLRYGATCPARAYAHVTSEVEVLYVQPRFARVGVGSKLLADCGLLARERTASPNVWLSVNTHNGAALAFYRKHGCEQVGSIDFEFGGERHENYVLVARGS